MPGQGLGESRRLAEDDDLKRDTEAAPSSLPWQGVADAQDQTLCDRSQPPPKLEGCSSTRG